MTTRHPACPPACRGVRTEGGKLLPFVKGRDCPACWRWTAHAFQRRKHGGDPADCLPVADAPKAPAPPARVALPVRGPCHWEGRIVQRCEGCGQADRHVHACVHPDPRDAQGQPVDREFCHRNHPDPSATNCSACGQWKVRGTDAPEDNT